jgi:hypothetical protein
MKNKFFYIFIFSYIFGLQAIAQNPPDILWKSIKTNNFKIIFPSEIENEAQRAANTLEWVYQNNTGSLKDKPRPVPVILFNRSVVSNAYASLSPRRMGWYIFPPQLVSSLGSLDWVQTLSIHEYRHIVQYAKNRQNFTKLAWFFYGSIGQSMMRYSIPDWFFEGDAIVMETALSEGGRGRMPEFDQEIRTFALQGDNYSYDQAYLGSYKRFYPSHYHLGYPLTAFARVNFGFDTWDKVLDRTSKISFWPYAFGGSLKKYTGLNVKRLYDSAMSDLKVRWHNNQEDLEITPAKKINFLKKKNYTNYLNPKYDKNGNIVFIKEPLDELPALFMIDSSGRETKIMHTDAGKFMTANNILVWDRKIPDARWSEQSFSDIVVFGLKSKKEKYISQNAKYLSPALSPDGKTIVAVKHNPDQKTFLCLIDLASGEEIASYSAGENDYIRTPVWSLDASLIAFTHARYHGPALSVLEIQTGKINKIVDYSYENIGNPVFYNNFILFDSPFSGIGNIYAVDINTGQKFQVTSRPYGAYQADVSPDMTRILFMDYDADGFNIAEMEIAPEKWKIIEEVDKTEQHYVKTLVEQEGNKTSELIEIQNINYPVTIYKKANDLLEIHSWGIFPYVPNLEFSVFSNNYLNTLNAQAGYIFDTNEKTSTGYVGISYSRFFPVITLVSSYGQRTDIYQLESGIVRDNWDEFKTNVSISLPFNLSRNIYNTSFNLKGAYAYIYTKDKANIRYLSQLPDGGFSQIMAGFNFNNTRRYAWRDFLPKWGQNFAVDYSQIARGGIYKGNLFSARSIFYFPGFFKQHSIKIGGAYEKQLKFNPDDYRYSYYFSSLISAPRGFISYTYDKKLKFSADYQFPLLYPDLSIGPLVYIKRIRAGGFFDYGKGFWGSIENNFRSMGGSIMFDFYIFRYRYPLQVGVQYAYRPDYQDGKKYDISLLIFGLPF